MKLSEFTIAKTKFSDFFKTGIGRFHEQFMSIGFGRVLIDIAEFDLWLHERHGDYEDEKLSLKDVVIKYYGNEAFKFLNDII
jgi:hypothetical protein